MSTFDSRQRELMYCHECGNEYWKDTHGLQCPRCDSEFTEAIEQTHDPAVSASPPRIFQHSLRNHNPWTNPVDAPDPDEEDPRDYEYEPSNASFHFGTFRPSGGRGESSNQTTSPFGALANLLAGMAQSQDYPQRRPPQPPQSGLFPRNPQSGDGTTRPQTHVFATTGPTFMFASGGPTRGAHGHDDGDIPFGDLQEMLLSLFGSIGRGTGQPGQAPPDLESILQAVLGSANARHGDGVYTNEAYDRILNQLLNEHQSSDAPGPASEAAINALPRRNAGPAELGEDGRAECSICMDTVTAGVELSVLPCSHWFHPDCVKAWLSEHDTCPVCRAGIMPRDGDRTRARTADQAPLNNQDPSLMARRQSGSQANPFIVPESPSRERRTPNFRRLSSFNAQNPPGAFPLESERGRQGSSNDRPSPLGGDSESSFGGGFGSGFGGRVRSFLGRGGGDGNSGSSGSGSNNNNNNNNNNNHNNNNDTID